MQDKLDAILGKLEEISERIGEIEERVEELENDTAAESNDLLCEIQHISQFVDILYDFHLMDFPQIDRENLIFIHTNAFRTASFVDSLVDPFGGLTETHRMTKAHLTPAHLLETIQNSENIVIRSDIFSWSQDFEKIVVDAIANKKVCFVILTNDLESIPQSIRSKMRVMQ